MKERPILFNSEMVRAILDGRKTQTRRILKFPENNLPPDESKGFTFKPEYYTHPCPYGQPGDRLWVKETWRGGTDTLESVWYKASDECALKYGFCQCAWKPSIFMPHEFSRITLEITNVRVERLAYISEQDAESEGCSSPCDTCGYTRKDQDIHMDHHLCKGKGWDNATFKFRDLWDKINGPGSWDKNPWVWAIEFKRI